jgi:signal peptidase I
MWVKFHLLLYNLTKKIMPPQQPYTPPPHITPPPPSGTPPITGNAPDYKKEEKKNIIYTILLFILAPVFALLMIIFVFQSYVVDGSSMEPTLQNGDRIFILKLPKTVANFSGDDFIPPRGEIIVFKKPSDPNVQLIKRVIGLPGERVVVKNGQITVYNSQNPDGFNPDEGTDYGDALAAAEGNVDIRVGEGELFVSGDNREPGGSLDSRTGLGLVPAENIVGRLWIRYFPISNFDVFANSLQSYLVSE